MSWCCTSFCPHEHQSRTTPGPLRGSQLTLTGTSVTAVLIGKETASRTYVKYEIEKSIERGNGLLGVRIEKIGDRDGTVDEAGPNPLPAGYKTYLWNKDDGYTNFGAWVEAAAKSAGR